MATILSRVEQISIDLNSIKLQYRCADITGKEAAEKSAAILNQLKDISDTLVRLLGVTAASRNITLHTELLGTQQKVSDQAKEVLEFIDVLYSDVMNLLQSAVESAVASRVEESSIRKPTPSASA